MPIASIITPPLTTLELVTAFRQEVDDLPGDIVSGAETWPNDDTGLLWKNEEIVRYANEAQVEFCRRKPIRDDTTAAVTQIAVVADTSQYAYHDKILSIRNVHYVDSNADEMTLTKRTHQQMNERLPKWRDEDAAPKLCHYIENEHERTIGIYPTPSLTGTLYLVVDRLPTISLAWNQRQKNQLDIADEHHLDLIYWMAHRALMKRDNETYNPEGAEHYRQLFDMKVGPRPSAHLERVRREERNTYRRVRARFL